MSKEEIKEWTGDDMIAFVKWYIMWRNSPKVGINVYNAFKNWKKGRIKK